MENIVLKDIYGKDVLVEIVDSQEDANFITHAGTFHADEVISTVLLSNKFENIKLARVNEVINKDAFVYDIGYGDFDHHGMDFNKVRENGIKYASCGLIWDAYGLDIIKELNISNAEEFVSSIDKNLIMDIDRDDNGQSLNVEIPVKIQGIPNLISSFNPAWDDSLNENECFLNAVSFANTIFNNIIKKMVAKEKAKEIVEQGIEKSENGILILDNYMPWKDIVLSSSNPKAKDILYAVFPSKRGGYSIVATPKEPGSFEVKQPFPASWAGLDELSLQKESNVDTITFCHKALFICACKTFDDALKIANIAINGKNI